MSFSQSASTVLSSKSFFSVALSGTKGIASAGSGLGLYYTTDSGVNWTQSDIHNDTFTLAMSGNNGIAGATRDNSGIYYTVNGGQNWIRSQTSDSTSENVIYTTGYFNSVAMSGSNGIAGSADDTGLYYTTNGGQNWTHNNSSIVNTKSFYSVALSGTKGIASSLGFGLYYTINGGGDWFQSDINAGDFYSVALLGEKGITGSFGSGMYYTTNGGQTWIRSDENSGGGYFSVAMSGTNGIAGAHFTGLIYTTDSGETWTQSNIETGTFSSVALSGSNGIAGSGSGPFSNLGLYFTTDGGVNWTQSNISTGSFNSVAISGSNAIAGSQVSTGIYYTSSPICYDENTLILILENNEEVYKKISELKVGDLVKVYKNGYKSIKLIKSFNYKCLNKGNPLNHLYKMKDNNVIVTGGHSILVDELTEEEYLKNKKFNFEEQIEDKKLLLASSSDKFERLENNLEYHLFHFALEDEDINKHFGIYINGGVLSESCSIGTLQR